MAAAGDQPDPTFAEAFGVLPWRPDSETLRQRVVAAADTADAYAQFAGEIVVGLLHPDMPHHERELEGERLVKGAAMVVGGVALGLAARAAYRHFRPI